MMHRTISYMLLLIAALLWSGCNPSSRKVYRIGVAQCSSDAWRWKTNDEMESERMFHDNVMVEVRSADDINERQIEDIHYFMDRKFDLIIVNPTQSDVITPVVEEAYRAGIPIITFDRRIQSDAYTAHMEVDNEALGREVAEYALSLFPQGARIIEVQGNRFMTSTRQRHDGFVDGLKGHDGMKLMESVYCDWNPDTTAVKMDSLLNRYPDVDLVYGHSDVMAIRVAEVARQKGRDSIRFLSIDGQINVGVKAVSDSILTATFLYPTYGYLLLRTALDILEGRPYERETILPPVSAVDLRNADIVKQQDEAQREEVQKIILLQGQLNEYWSRLSTRTNLLYAAGLIVLLSLVAISLFVHYLRVRERYQHSLEEKNRLLEEATRSKLAFYTNVSHDLRTPLTLIEEPVRQLETADYLKASDRTLMHIAAKNIRILRRLIDEILDFRKYENGKLTLHLTETAVGPLLHDWVQSFETIARKRGMQLEMDIPAELSGTLAVDVEKLERIVFNLVSNSFKYTADGGTIRVMYRLDGQTMTFAVTDTGKGISASDLPHIFDRFYQADKVHPDGSGIGLSVTKAFVELHEGAIRVESEEKVGTTFFVTLPVRHVEEASPLVTVSLDVLRQEEPVLKELEEAEEEQLLERTEKPLLLVVDDNPDICRLMKELLGNEYQILTAANGLLGVDKARRWVPDLMICDVMMPVMDGLECCRRVKTDMTTSHIPVLMLTACSLDEQRVQGYESGADGYLSKPFNMEVLRSRCKNLLLNRQRIRNIYRVEEKPVVNEEEPRQTPNLEDKFYRQFLEIFEAEISNTELGVEWMAEQLGMGRSQLGRKIKALTGLTPVELIRTLRLEKARELLSTTEMNVSEVAYEVGFNTPAYFTKCYREVYGETPSEKKKK